LTRRIGDREVHPALRHLEYHNGCDTGHERQGREANNVDCWQRTRCHASTEPIEQPPSGEDLRRQGKESDCKVDAGEDTRLLPGVMDRRRYDMCLLEIENGRTKRQ
jgi:hypothetical protein